jgi:hypothetical protein
VLLDVVGLVLHSPSLGLTGVSLPLHKVVEYPIELSQQDYHLPLLFNQVLLSPNSMRKLHLSGTRTLLYVPH